MASAYCDTTDITALLPPNHGLSSAQLTTAQSYGSREVDRFLAHLYWPFPAHDASIATPVPVRLAATYFALWHALRLMSTAQGFSDDTDAQNAFERGIQLVGPLADGTQKLANETISKTIDTTVWGDGDPFTTDEAELDVSEVTTICDSAEIAGYKLGEDFYIQWKPESRAYVLVRLDSNIGSQDGANADTLTYEFSYLKKREVVQPGIRSARLIRA